MGGDPQEQERGRMRGSPGRKGSLREHYWASSHCGQPTLNPGGDSELCFWEWKAETFILNELRVAVKQVRCALVTSYLPLVRQNTFMLNRLDKADLLLQIDSQGQQKPRIHYQSVPQGSEKLSEAERFSIMYVLLAPQMRDLWKQPALGFILWKK